MHRVMCDSPYLAAARLPDTESLPPGGIGGRLSKGHIDYDPFAATLDCLTQAMQARSGAYCQVFSCRCRAAR